MHKNIPLVFVLVLVLGLSLFFGCQGCSRSNPEDDTVTIWHWMLDREEAFNTLAEKYEQETGQKVVFELYAPSDVYSQKIVAAAQARILPDIFGILDKKAVFATFIDSGFGADLSADFSVDSRAWEKSFFPKALASNRFSEDNDYGIPAGIYGVPIDVTNIQMLYNKKLLQKAGIEKPPKTFAEFIEAIEALNRVGVSGLVSGWGELWMADCFASNYAFNILGEEKVLDTFRGKVPYTDPDWIKVFQIFATLRDRKALIDGIVTKANKFAEQDFALERAAFAFNGSWCVNVYNDMNPDLEYGAMLPPAVESRHPMRIWGGAGSSFVVNNSSTRKGKAIAFLKWLSAKEQQVYLSQETKNLPSNRYALTDIPEVLSEFARAMDATTHPTIWPLNEEPLVVEAFDKGLQSILIGEKTPQQVAEEVQKIKTRQMAKKEKRANR